MKWWATAPSMGLALSGPYETQVRAYEAMRLTADAQVAINRIWPADLQVWPDERSREEILNEDEKNKVKEKMHHREVMRPAYDIATRKR
jgi:hypothetical protein